jgi:potassium-transporting ATPase ATP-binding subunit
VKPGEPGVAATIPAIGTNSDQSLTCWCCLTNRHVAKYFAIVPAMFAGTLPWLKAIDVMNLHSPTSAILSAVIFNALIIPLLIPIALKGVQYRPLGADALLRRNLLIWGLGGVIVPFIGIKVIDMVMVALHLVA